MEKTKKNQNGEIQQQPETPEEKFGGIKRKAPSQSEETDGGNFSAQKRQRSSSGRFQRVDPNIQYENRKLADNSYAAKGGESWGYKAQSDFSKVKGYHFRHEKTKKKRGSYRGGTISLAVNSVSLCNSDDDEIEA